MHMWIAQAVGHRNRKGIHRQPDSEQNAVQDKEQIESHMIRLHKKDQVRRNRTSLLVYKWSVSGNRIYWEIIT